MKTLWVSLGAMILFAGYGNADVSDSGNLTIGNSAQFGSGVTRSTFTSTGLLKLTASGVQWADGSTSTTSVSGGAGAPTSGNNTWTGTNVFQSTVTVGQAAGSSSYVQGSWFQVAYSSGAPGANVFSFVINSSSTYEWNFTGVISTGTTLGSGGIAMRCSINGDSTAAHYIDLGYGYPNLYNFNNTNVGAFIALNSCDSGSIGPSDFAHDVLKFSTVPGYPGTLSFTGTIAESCETKLTAAATVLFVGGYYVGTAPYTFTCFPVTGDGWQYESILLQFGK